MAVTTPVSAGIYVREFDYSDYATLLSTTIVAVVGGATKGPINTPTVINSEQQLVQIFGAPTLGLYNASDYGLLSAVRFLKQGNRLLYTRISSIASPVASASCTISGANGAIATFGTVVPGSGYTNGTYTNVPLTGGSGTGATATIVVAGAVVTTVTITVGGANYIVGDSLSAASSSIGGTGTGFSVPVATIGVASTGSAGLVISAISPGTWGNALRYQILPFGIINGQYGATTTNFANRMTGGTGTPTNIAAIASAASVVPNSAYYSSSYFDLVVYSYDSVAGTYTQVERFNNLSTLSTSDRYIVNILAYGKSGETSGSQYISAKITNTDGGTVSQAFTGTTGTAWQPLYYGVTAQGSPVSGSDGIPVYNSADYLASYVGVTAPTPTGLQCLANPETTEFNVLMAPGAAFSAVIGTGSAGGSGMLDIATKRGDCFVLVDPPFGLAGTNPSSAAFNYASYITAWHNGTVNGTPFSTAAWPNAPAAPLDSSYGAVFGPWIQVFDSYVKATIWLPPSAFVAAALAYNDSVNGPWAIPAGYTRGKIAGIKGEVTPNQSDRDLMCGINTTNRVNPITSFYNSGLLIWGNRTLQRKQTALTNIHTRRMLLYAEKLIATTTQYLTFEPNDQTTWRKFTALVNPILARIASARGLETFKVVCDITTNPPAQRQNKTMNGKILIAAMEGAEIITEDFVIFGAGTTFSNTSV
jgi:uncharacterized protein